MMNAPSRTYSSRMHQSWGHPFGPRSSGGPGGRLDVGPLLEPAVQALLLALLQVLPQAGQGTPGVQARVPRRGGTGRAIARLAVWAKGEGRVLSHAAVSARPCPGAVARSRSG